MPSTALSTLHDFHQRLVSSVRAGIKHFHPQSHPAIAAYAQKFQEQLPADYQRVESIHLVQQALCSDVVLFGDFHTLPQSQAAFLDLLRRLDETQPRRNLVLAMEIFSSTDQELLDDYLNGSTPEEYFLKRIDYQSKWGFPWEHYRPIIDYCMKNKIGITGINYQTSADDRLAKRDGFAAEQIAALRKKDPNTLVLCLIGEYHLGEEHLPSRLDPSFNVLRVVANLDEYSLLSLDTEYRPYDVLQLRENFFCVLNTSPWLKWQSLALWEELSGAGDAHEEPYTEHPIDFEYQLLALLKALNDLLNLGLSSSQMAFDIYLKPDKPTLAYLRSKLGLSRIDFAAVERRLALDGFCYIPKSRALLLMSESVEPLLEAAGYILSDCLNPQGSGDESFVQRVNAQICASLCALVLNPRRPMRTSQSIEDAIQKTQRKRLLGPEKKLREAMKVVREIQNSGPHQARRTWSSKTLEAKDSESSYQVSRLLGEALAHRIFFSGLLTGDAEIKKGLAALLTKDLFGKLAYLSELKSRLAAAS